MPDLFADAKGWVEVDEDNFEQEVLEAEQPVMVEFWGEQCEKCEDVTPTIKTLAKDYSNKVKFCHWRCPCLYAVKNLGVRNLPTLYFYKKGKKETQLVKKDTVTEESVRKNLETLLA